MASVKLAVYWLQNGSVFFIKKVSESDPPDGTLWWYALGDTSTGEEIGSTYVYNTWSLGYGCYDYTGTPKYTTPIFLIYSQRSTPYVGTFTYFDGSKWNTLKFADISSSADNPTEIDCYVPEKRSVTVSVGYGGSTIATVAPGELKTVACGGKLMSADIVLTGT